MSISLRRVLAVGAVAALVSAPLAFAAASDSVANLYISADGQGASPLATLVGQDLSLEAVCSLSTSQPCPEGANYSWYAPNANLSSSSAQAVVSFPSPGMYTVRVSVAAPGLASAQASVPVAVSNPLADTSSPGSYAAVASGLIPSCGPYTGLPGDDYLSSELVGQAAFCPTPRPGPAGSDIPSNGVDVLKTCLTSPALCSANPNVSAAVLDSGQSMTCTTGQCSADVITAKLADVYGLREHTAASCQDNVTTRIRTTTAGQYTETLRGTEPGCATRQDAALTVLALANADVRAPYPSPTVPLANLLTNPTLESGLEGWDVSGADASSAKYDSSSSSSLRVANSSEDQFVIALASNTVKGQTYTGSVFVRSLDKDASIGLSIVGRDAQGEWIPLDESGISPVFTQSTTNKWNRMWVTGIAPSSEVGLRVDIPAGSKNVFLDDAALTSSTSPLPFSTEPVLAYCPAGPAPSQAVVDAAALNPQVSLCDSDAALTRDYAAQVLHWALGPAAVPPGPTAQAFADASSAQAAVFSSLFSAGVAVPGTLRCPDAYTAPMCLNAWRALTREEYAQMVSPLLGSALASASSAQLSASALNTSLGGADATSVQLTLTVPATTPVGTVFDVSAEGGVCPVSQMEIGPKHTASLTCFAYAKESPGSSTATFTATAGEVAASASVNITTTFSKPLVPALYLPTSEKDPAASFPAFAVSLDGDDVTVGVRSCNTATEDCVTSASNFPQTSRPRTLTSDSNPNAFVSTANTEIGTVSITQPVQGRSVLTVTGFTDTSLPTAGVYTNGQWQFVLQACNSQDQCKSTLITNYRTPEPDAPVAQAQTVSAKVGNSTSFTLFGSDLYDLNRDPGSSSPIASVVWDSLPGSTYGSLQVVNGGSTGPVAVGTAYPLATTFRWTGTLAGGPVSATFHVVEENEPALSSLPAQVSFTTTP